MRVALLCLLLTGCTLVHVGVNSDGKGHTEVHPNGVYVHIDKGMSNEAAW